MPQNSSNYIYAADMPQNSSNKVSARVADFRRPFQYFIFHDVPHAL